MRTLSVHSRKQPVQLEHLEERVVPSASVFRTINGTENHPFDLGAAHTTLQRLAPSAYPGDGSGDTIIEFPARENPRVISNMVVEGASILNARQLSDFVWQWGQFLDHDINLTEGHPDNGTADIPVPDGDILGPNPIPFNRSDFIGTPRQQLNEITAFIDASNVYGSEDAQANSLRTFVDGKMITTAGGQLLPVVEGEFVAGDVRANEQVGLTSMHTLFVREHNRLADALGNLDDIDTRAAEAGVSRDEYIYQVARKIVGAEMQIITYNEFLPALLGPHAPQATDVSYSSTVDPSIANEFSTALFRVGHTMLSPQLLLVGQDHVGQSLELKNAFFNPEFPGGDLDDGIPEDTGNVERLLKGLAFQRMQEIDATIVDDVRNFLFGPPGAGGLDLASLNLQRGRDHGLPDYNTLRVAYGLTARSAFWDPGDGSGITSNPELAAKLAAVYDNDINNVDPWLGGIAEDHLPGGSMGELITTALTEQFVRLRDGDRFFYLNDSFLSDEIVSEVIDLDAVTLSSVIHANTDITGLQENVFLATGVVVEGGTLRIHGTAAADHIVVRKLGSDHVLVQVDFLPGGTKVFEAEGIERIEVHGFDGNDQIRMGHSLASIIDGGSGDDTIIGGLGSNVLVGGQGNDMLLGRGGRDIVIGGAGVDLVYTAGNQDILIGGDYSQANDVEALHALMEAWNRNDLNFNERVTLITETGVGSDNSVVLNETTISDDEELDMLLGGWFGRDLFFASDDDFTDAIFHDELIEIPEV